MRFEEYAGCPPTYHIYFRLQLVARKKSVELNITQLNSIGIKLSFENLWEKVEIN